jgi:hypothetical protein
MRVCTGINRQPGADKKEPEYRRTPPIERTANSAAAHRHNVVRHKTMA